MARSWFVLCVDGCFAFADIIVYTVCKKHTGRSVLLCARLWLLRCSQCK